MFSFPLPVVLLACDDVTEVFCTGVIAFFALRLVAGAGVLDRLAVGSLDFLLLLLSLLCAAFPAILES